MSQTGYERSFECVVQVAQEQTFAATATKSCLSADHLIGTQEGRRWDRQPECFGRLEIDDQFEHGRLLYRQIARFCTLEDLVHIPGGSAEQDRAVGPIGHQPAFFGVFARPVGGRQPSSLERQLNKRRSMNHKQDTLR